MSLTSLSDTLVQRVAVIINLTNISSADREECFRSDLFQISQIPKLSGFYVRETADIMDSIKQATHTRCFLNFLVSCNQGKISLNLRCASPVCRWHVRAARVPVPSAVWVSSKTAFSAGLAVQITVEQTQLNHTLCWSSKQPLLETKHTQSHGMWSCLLLFSVSIWARKTQTFKPHSDIQL